MHFLYRIANVSYCQPAERSCQFNHTDNGYLRFAFLVDCVWLHLSRWNGRRVLDVVLGKVILAFVWSPILHGIHRVESDIVSKVLGKIEGGFHRCPPLDQPLWSRFNSGFICRCLVSDEVVPEIDVPCLLVTGLLAIPL